MASTSTPEIAQEILDGCLQDRTWPSRLLDTLLDRAVDNDPWVEAAATRAFFSILIEGLADRFEPELCEIYVDLFTRVIARVLPSLTAEELKLRYNRIRQARQFWGGEVQRVHVLSRITLGADVAVTSVVLAAMKERFPGAEICLVGPAKNAKLFGADPAIRPIPLDYMRSGTLRERLQAASALQTVVDEPGALVVDPDSRLTQLGLIPVCDDARYFFFESRAFGGTTDISLPRLTAEWLEETFGVSGAKPYVAPPVQEPVADITVSWGVGENPNKRLDGDFEYQALELLLKKGRPVLLDRGAGGEEAERVDALAQRLASPLLKVHDGTYASFASHIRQSTLYVGYDSAGQHVASASGVPLISIFAGYPCERMMWRWRPEGPNTTVITAANPEELESARDRALDAIAAAS